MTKCIERMNMEPMQDHLKRHLLWVFVAAFAYNSTMTFAFLESRQLTKELIEQTLQIAPTMTNTYERKLFVIGLSCILASPQIPHSLIESIKQIIQWVVMILTK